MAACAACRYAGKIGTVSGIGTALYKFKAFSVEGKSNTTSAIQFLASLSSFSSPSGYCRRSDYRPFSQFVKSSGGRLFPVDTLAQIEMTQESNLSKFKSEVESSQGHHFSLLQHETKKLRSDIEKMRSELRYKTDDVTIAIRAEFAYHKAKTNHMYSKLDRGIHALSVEIEATKNDVIKYFIGTFVYIATVGVAVIRILM